MNTNRLISLILLSVSITCSCYGQQQAAPVKIIFDTDMLTDPEDVNALCLLHAFADRGECEILATVLNGYERNKAHGAAVDVVNTFHGRPDIPIGTYKDGFTNKYSHFSSFLRDRYPHDSPDDDHLPSALEVYRKTLAEQPDRSVTIVSVGFLLNIHDLLASPKDKYSDLDGKELVRRKVKEIVVMGGKYPQGREYNFYYGGVAPSAKYVCDNCPDEVPLIFSGYEIGERIISGKNYKVQLPPSPLRTALENAYGSDAVLNSGRHSWDETAVIYAVRGAKYNGTEYWKMQTKGSVEVDCCDGSCRWVSEPDKNQAYMIESVNPDTLAVLMEDLILTSINNALNNDPPAVILKPTPVIHLTDLYHPHGDPDDHFDLACLYSLAAQGKIDLKGIGLDYPPDFRKGDPDLMAVAQLNYICGLDVPAFIGSAKLLQTKTDTLPGLKPQNATGINRIIRILRESTEPVAIIVVGSATDVAVAALREPELFRTKCAGIYLNSGATHQNQPSQLEFNVNLNPAAYAALFSLPCPLYWFPCWNVCEERKSGEWGSFYWLQHADAFKGINPQLQTYFHWMFSQSKEPDWLRALKTVPPEDKWNEILKERRGMWSTASILMTAGLTVTLSGDIVPMAQAGDRALFRMEYVDVKCEDDGRLQWNLSDKPTNCRLLHVLDPASYPAAMSKAVNTLLCNFQP